MDKHTLSQTSLSQQRCENTASYKEIYAIVLNSMLSAKPTAADSVFSPDMITPSCRTSSWVSGALKGGAAKPSRALWLGQTCLQQQCQGPAAQGEPHDLPELGVCPAPQLHPTLRNGLRRSPGEFSFQSGKPGLVNTEDKERDFWLQPHL